MLVIEEAIGRWFTQNRGSLEGIRSPHRHRWITSSGRLHRLLKTISTSACLVAGHKRVLPAKALLRSAGEFTASLKYCIAGDTKEEVDERIQRWRKSSWKKYKEYWEAVRNACKGADCADVDERIRQADSELAQMTGLREFSQTKQILEWVFSQDLAVRVGVYAQYLSATHIDIVTLAQTITEEAGTTEYVGDLVDDKPGIET